MRLFTLLLLTLLLGGCGSAPPREEALRILATATAEPVSMAQKSEKDMGYINHVLFQRIPIKKLRDLGHGLEATGKAFNQKVYKPIDRARRWDVGAYHLKIEADIDIQLDFQLDRKEIRSLGLFLVITW